MKSISELEQKVSKIKDPSERIRIMLMEYRYEMALHAQATDEDVIETLDAWLENWLYRKDHCPNCGNTCEDYDVEEV